MILNDTVKINPEELFKLFPLFQKGVGMQIPAGCSINSLFHDAWKLAPDFVENRIATIFLNGKPVDDMEAATMRDGFVLALSSAMPGLAGATMRRGGFFSSLRDSITHREDEDIQKSGEGMITVRLFNMLMKELGPTLLRIGFWVGAGELEGIAAADSGRFKDGSMIFVTGS